MSFRLPSVRRSCRRACRQSCPMPSRRASATALLKATGNGIHALQGTRSCCLGRTHVVWLGFVCWPSIDGFETRPADEHGCRQGRTDLTPASLGSMVEQVCSLRSVVRESNPRLPDSKSGALPTELTTNNRVCLEPNHGTHSTNQFRWGRVRRWSRRDHRRFFVCSRLVSGGTRLLHPFRVSEIVSRSPRAALRSALGWYIPAPSGQRTSLEPPVLQPGDYSSRSPVGRPTRNPPGSIPR